MTGALVRPISSIAKYPAAQDSGLADSVPPTWMCAPLLPSSPDPKTAMMSARPPTPPAIGYPPATALPSTVRSGVTPKYPAAPPMPNRNPVTTSSKTSSAPNSSHSSRTLALKSCGAGRVPDSGPSGSTTIAAVPPRARFSTSLRRSVPTSCGNASRVWLVAPNGMPLAFIRKLPGTRSP